MSELNKVGAVVLAAGKGTRLNCADIPKVMLKIGSKPIVAYTIENLKNAGFADKYICLVVGFRKETVMDYFGDRVIYAEQKELLGTAHAANAGIVALPEEVETALVLGGDDSAFYRPATILDFVKKHVESGCVLSLLSAKVKDPSALGRVVRHADGQIEIIEKEYLTAEQKKINEISTGTYCFNRKWFESMFKKMPKLRKLGEYGLPTAMAMAREQNKKYQVIAMKNSAEWFGVNTRNQLKEANKRKIAESKL